MDPGAPGTSQSRSRRTDCCRSCPGPNSSRPSSVAEGPRTARSRRPAALGARPSGSRSSRQGPLERLASDEVAVGIDVQLLEIKCERRLISFDGEGVGDACREGLPSELDPGDPCAADIVDAPHLHGNAEAFRPQLDELRPYPDLDALVFRKHPINPAQLDRMPVDPRRSAVDLGRQDIHARRADEVAYEGMGRT